jgi:hypothetical protein
MRIKILGNGGYINNGIPYNSFVIDDTFIIEAPPDIIEKAIPITGSSTRYVGVHLSGITTRDSGCLKYSRVGEEYDIV